MKEKFRKCTLIALLMLGTAAYAEDNEEYSLDTASQEREVVNSRPLSEEDHAHFIDMLLDTSKQEKNKSLGCKKDRCPHLIPPKHILAGCICRDRGSRPLIYPMEDCHFLNTVHIERKAIILEDGSVWKVRPSDEYKMYNWKKGASLVITQNRNWCSSQQYLYLIINQDTNDVVESYLYDGPVKNGQNHRFIQAMDFYVGEVVLNNGSCWKLYEQDYHIFKSWFVNDIIIIGVNTGWATEMTNILININNNTFVRAKRF